MSKSSIFPTKVITDPTDLMKKSQYDIVSPYPMVDSASFAFTASLALLALSSVTGVQNGYYYTIPSQSSDPAVNGSNLIAAYCALTSGSWSAASRAAVMLMPGVYNLGGTTLTMWDYIDLIGLGGNSKFRYVSPAPAIQTAIPDAVITGNGTVIIDMSQCFDAGAHSFCVVQTNASNKGIKCGSGSNQTVSNVEVSLNTSQAGFYSDPGVPVRGYFEKCNTNGALFGNASTVKASFVDCAGWALSFGQYFSGKAQRCWGGNGSFGLGGSGECHGQIYDSEILLTTSPGVFYGLLHNSSIEIIQPANSLIVDNILLTGAAQTIVEGNTYFAVGGDASAAPALSAFGAYGSTLYSRKSFVATSGSSGVTITGNLVEIPRLINSKIKISTAAATGGTKSVISNSAPVAVSASLIGCQFNADVDASVYNPVSNPSNIVTPYI